jgi:hypothetical protein
MSASPALRPVRAAPMRVSPEKDMLTELRKCIRLNLDCADICEVTGRVLTRQSEYDASLTKAQLQACREACATCAEECERHGEMHHCSICAEACRRCQRPVMLSSRR